MAHKTLVSGTAYNITGGKSMVSGTAYNIKSGRTLVGGTGYNINFGGGEATALLYNTGDFAFQRSTSVEEGKTLKNSYTGFEENSYYGFSSVPWNKQRANIKNAYCNEEIAPTSIAYWFYNCKNLVYFNNRNFNMSKITNMVNAYYYCNNLRSSPVCGDNVTNMVNAYYFCNGLTGSPVCGEKVTDMARAYYYCNNLTGSPVCGEKVTNMANTYIGCSKLTGSPVCGDNVTSLSDTYKMCYNLTGSPICGSKVTSLYYTYYKCYNLTGSPVCGDKVTVMDYAYSNCYNLIGSPVCGKNVTDMDGTYSNCRNLTGYAICGPNVTSISGTYANCTNISGNAYFYSTEINSVTTCFGGKNNSKRLNIYVPANSTTNTIIRRNNTKSLIGRNIVWTNSGSYTYNKTYNIYIYPVANVAAAAIANGDEEANANAGIV